EIGFVFQQFFLAEHATARENVADGLLYAGVPAAERYRRADETLERGRRAPPPPRGHAAPTRRSNESASPRARPSSPPSSPAASGSASRSPAPSSGIRRSSSPANPPATSTTPPAPPSTRLL